jgi:hypothetical protein
MSKHENTPTGPADFVHYLTERANHHHAAMAGMNGTAAFAYVENVVASNDVVFGVYQDAGAPFGVGLYPIKGRRHLEAVKASGSNAELRTDAVPCIEEEQAIAAEQRFGDKAH